MNFSNETLKILNNFSKINTNMMFKKGTKLNCVSPTKSIIGIANIAETIESDFGIFDLPQFLGVLSLFANPTIKTHDKYAVISEDSRKIRYSFAAPNMIMQPPSIPNLPDPDIEFAVETKTISTLTKTAAVLGLDMFEIRCDGKNISVAIIDSKKATDNEFTVVIAETDEVFSVKLKVEDFKILESDYTVYLNKNGLVQFKNDVLHYFIMGTLD